ncbi:MAG: DNA sulfur modification protein DndB [Acidimicrobiaceae bacterium]|nr:DNA sulfur modification protein DndB [Acidimicrobiaceae bacterium]
MTDLLRPTFRVPAMRGRMGSTQYFTATLPLGAVTKLFAFDPDEMHDLEPEHRSQRLLKTKRIPEIAAYILDHDDFIFSAITVSVDSDDVGFDEVADGADIGELVLPLEARYVINDGQHRVAGIKEALKSDRRLAEDTIAVVVLPDGGLERSQQIFSDLNRTVHKTSKSLDILYDHRLPVHRITMACTEQVPLFRGRIDKERVSLSPRSANFATLSGLQQANVNLLGDHDESLSPHDEQRLLETAVSYWRHITELVPPWRDIVDGAVKPPEARQRYVSAYALSLWALGAVGAAAGSKDPSSRTDWHEALAGLAHIDWRKTNQDWQGVCMIGDEIVTRQPTRRATAGYILWKIGIARHPPAAPLEIDDRASREPTSQRPRPRPAGLAAMHQSLEPDHRIDTGTPRPHDTATDPPTPASSPPPRRTHHGPVIGSDVWREAQRRIDEWINNNQDRMSDLVLPAIELVGRLFDEDRTEVAIEVTQAGFMVPSYRERSDNSETVDGIPKVSLCCWLAEHRMHQMHRIDNTWHKGAPPEPANSVATPRSRPTAVVLFGERHPVNTHGEGLVKLLETLHQQDPHRFANLLEIRGRKRPFLSRDPQQLFRPRQIATSGYFVNVNLSKDNINRKASLCLQRLGHNSSDFAFRYD